MHKHIISVTIYCKDTTNLNLHSNDWWQERTYEYILYVHDK